MKRISRQASNLLVEVQFLPRAPKQNSTAFSKPICGTREARWLEAESYARIVLPLPRFTRQPQKEKNVPYFSDFCARPIFPKMERIFLLLGFRLPSIQAGGWASMRDSVLRKLFSGDFDFRKTETNFFGENSELIPPAERGLGMNAGGFFVLNFLRVKIEKESG